MKRPLAILSIFLAMLAAVSMAVPVAADDPTPTGTTEPPALMHVHAAYGSFVTGRASGYLACSTIEGNNYRLEGSGYLSWQIAEFDTAGFTCLGEITYNVTYEWPTGDRSSGEMFVSVTNTDTIYYDADFQQTTGAVEYAYGNVNTPGSFGATNGSGEITGSITHGGSGNLWNAGALTQYLFVHDETKPPCGSDWEAIDIVDQGEILATAEEGVTETLIPDEFYRLTIYGGPWNDSLADRHDTAFKIGDGEWTPQDEFFELNGHCSEADPLDPNKLIILFRPVVAGFAIRVNDIDDFFADNTGSMSFRLEQVQPQSGGCEEQFLVGNLITSGTIPATSSAGVSPNFGLRPSPYYAGTWIKIVTSGGPWKNDGTGADKYDIALNNTGSAWEELSGSSYASCTVTDGDYITAYVQLATNNGIKLRVNDTAAWTGNTGSMGYAIYAVTYSPRDPIGCAEYYHLGSLIKTVEVFGNFEAGARVGTLFPGLDVTGGEEYDSTSYIAIETEGLWYNGSTPNAYGGIAASTTAPATGTYEDLQVYSEVECYAQLDPVGHIRVYIPIGPNTENYWLRAEDQTDNWADNSGYMFFKIYTATLLRPPDYTPGTMPGAGICDDLYTKGAAGPTYTLYGDYSGFISMPAMTTGKIYALEVSAGPWLNDSVGSYEVEINDGISSYNYNLVDFPGTACAQSADGFHLLMYFQALAGRHYKIRVYDPGIDFTDNEDSIDVILYNEVTNTIIPPGSCTDDYTLTPMGVEDNHIPGNPAGVEIAAVGIGSGEMYAIEINEEDYWWYIATPTQHHYNAEITTDNGSNWEAFDGTWTGAVCARKLNTATDYGAIYRIYFTAPDSGVLKMRREGTALLTQGNLTYSLYGATPITDDPPGPIVPPGWQASCFENYLRPGSLIKWSSFSLGSISFGSLGTVTFPTVSLPVPAVDDWISYLQWTVRSYFAWCPQHTAALDGIPTSMGDYEPFGTLNEIDAAYDRLGEVLDQMQTAGGEGEDYAPYSVVFSAGGGEDGDISWNGMFQAPGESSPWAWSGGPATTHYGEDLTFDPDIVETSESGNPDYVAYCDGILEAHFGTAVSTGICTLTDMARSVPTLWVFIQFILDIGITTGLIAYVKTYWLDPRMSA